MSLDELKKMIAECQKCNLSRFRQNIVFGEGNPHAGLMLVGEGPGAREDELGRPFVGAAGELLNRILKAVSLSREEVYIANVVKCRPPGNRLPAAEEAGACYDYLRKQISIIEPRIIVCLGALATRTLINPDARITRVRGSWFNREGCWVMPTFHPAALLRDPAKKKPVWEDFQEIYAQLTSLPEQPEQKVSLEKVSLNQLSFDWREK